MPSSILNWANNTRQLGRKDRTSHTRLATSGPRRWCERGYCPCPPHHHLSSRKLKLHGIVPLGDALVDTVVLSYALCTVGSVEDVIEEVRRVLKPGGGVLFLEHVRAPTPCLARWQQRLQRPWAASEADRPLGDPRCGRPSQSVRCRRRDALAELLETRHRRECRRIPPGLEPFATERRCGGALASDRGVVLRERGKGHAAPLAG